MKIGVISDTHKNMVLLNKVIEWLSKQHVPLLYHLGDDYGDVAELEDMFSEVVHVPGLYDKEYKSEHVNVCLLYTS
ncbi:MAG: metallophosphatase family protein, partial [Chitinispirillaceae bacterium]|nr:metallophosphatase family protein [Chitinispirillaceae bacterium]